MIRFLQPDEYHLIESILADNNASAPPSELSRIAIAQDDNGDIIGLAILQMAYHLEPVWIKESERGGGLWKDLMDFQLDAFAKLLTRINNQADIYTFAPRAAIERLLERRLGFEKLLWNVMRKTIKKED